MKIRKILSILAFLTLPILAGTQPAKPKWSLIPIKNIVVGYRTADGMQMDVKKTYKNEILGEEKLSEGQLFLSRGKLRLNIEKPEVTLLVYDGQNIWMETVPPKEMKSKTQVSKFKMTSKKKNSVLLALLFGTEGAWDQFKVTNLKKTDSELSYELEPKNAKETPDVTRLSITIAPKTREILSLAYVDDKENQTEFIFSNIKKMKSVGKEKFSYKAPADADVTVFN